VTAMSDKRTVLGTGVLMQIALAALVVVVAPRFAIGNLHIRPSSLLSGAAAGVLLYLVLARAAFPPRAAFTARVRSLLLKSTIVVVVAWAEETLWRGAVLGLLEPRGIALALGLTTVCFAAAHVFGQGWSAFGQQLLTGLTFGSLFLATGSLAAAILAHGIYNAFVVAADHGLRNSRLREMKVQGTATCS